MEYLEPVRNELAWKKYCKKETSDTARFAKAEQVIRKHYYKTELDIQLALLEALGPAEFSLIKGYIPVLKRKVQQSLVVVAPPTAEASMVFNLFLNTLFGATITCSAYPDATATELSYYTVYLWLIMHLTYRISDKVDGLHGLMFYGPANTGKSTLTKFTNQHHVANDAKGVGIWASTMPVYNLEDCTIERLTRHAETLRPLVLGQPISVKVHSTTEQISGKWVIASSNADIQQLDMPDLRRWVVVKMDVPVTAVDMNCGKEQIREEMLKYFKRLSTFAAWTDSVMYKSEPSIQFYTDQILQEGHI